MKTAFFSYLPTGGAVRVAGQQLYNLRNRFDWHAYLPQGGTQLLPESGIPVTTYDFPAGKRLKGVARLAAPVLLWRKALAYKALSRRIARDIANSRARSLLVHPSLIVPAPPLLLFPGPPSVFFCHEYPRYIYEKGMYKTGSALTELLIAPLIAWEKRLDKQAAQAATILLANSAFTGEKLRQVYSREVVVVLPGVDTDFFTTGNGDKGNFVLTVGALSEFKRHHLVVEALSMIPEMKRPAMITVADRGEEGYSEYLASMASRLGVDLTIERGISDTRLRELYRRAIIVACPQRNEPYGLVPLEAMACGTLVVAVDQGGFRENITNGETGFLVEPHAGAMADVLKRFSGNHHDSSAMETAGREFVLSSRSIHGETDKVAALLEKAAVIR